MPHPADLPETEYNLPRPPELIIPPLTPTTPKPLDHQYIQSQKPHKRRRSAPINRYQQHHHHTKQDLTNWLTTAQMPQSTNHHANQQKVQPLDPPNPQTILNPEKENKIWGDPVAIDQHQNTFRILSRNINTLSPADDFIDWKAAAQALAEYSVTLVCFQETNLQWTTPITDCITQIFRNLPPKQAKVATSNSTETMPSNYQPGGTCTALLGPWISSAKLSGKDASGMGRWSFIEMEGKEARRIIIVSGYRSCNQNT